MTDSQTQHTAATLACCGCTDIVELAAEGVVASGQIATFVAAHRDHQPGGFQLLLGEREAVDPPSLVSQHKKMTVHEWEVARGVSPN